MLYIQQKHASQVSYTYKDENPWVRSHWWCHQMETFFALLALCAGNSPVTGEFPSQRPVTWSFGVFFDLCLNKRSSKQSRRRWFETPSRSLWRHCNVLVLMVTMSLWKLIMILEAYWYLSKGTLHTVTYVKSAKLEHFHSSQVLAIYLTIRGTKFTDNQSSNHYSDVIMSVMASQITGVSIVYSTVCSAADRRKHQSSASLAFARGIHRWPVNSPHTGPVTRKLFQFDDVIMYIVITRVI